MKKYNLVISYPVGKYVLWNNVYGNEWEIMFEYEEQLLKFLAMLLESDDGTDTQQ